MCCTCVCTIRVHVYVHHSCSMFMCNDVFLCIRVPVCLHDCGRRIFADVLDVFPCFRIFSSSHLRFYLLHFCTWRVPSSPAPQKKQNYMHFHRVTRIPTISACADTTAGSHGGEAHFEIGHRSAAIAPPGP